MAILEAQNHSTCEFRVFLSHRFFERNPQKRARKLFHHLKLDKNNLRNAVFLYLNLKAQKFAFVLGDAIIDQMAKPELDTLSQHLTNDLLSTHPSNAIALTIQTLGVSLEKHFPQL